MESDGHSKPPYGDRLGGGAVRPLCRGVASSEAEMSFPLEGSSLPSSEAEMRYPLEGRFATLERGRDCPAGLRGVRMGHMWGFFESFSFFQIWKEAVGLRGPGCLNMFLHFEAV